MMTRRQLNPTFYQKVEKPTHRPASPKLLWFAEILRIVLGFVVLSILTRHVAADALGTYLALVTVTLVTPRLLDFGLPNALSYFLRVEPRGLRSASAMLARHVAFSIPPAACLAIGMRYFPFAGHAVTSVTTDHWITLTLLILSELAILLSLAMFVPTGRFMGYLATVLSSPCMVIAGLALWRGPRPEASQLLQLLQCASLTGSVVASVVLVRAARQGQSTSFPVAQAYRYGLQSYGSGVAKVVAQRFDRLFLAIVLGVTGYAQYSLAVSIRDIAVFPANLHAMTLRNAQVDIVTRDGNVKGGRSMLIRVSAMWVMLGIIGTLAMFPFWSFSIHLLFDNRYEHAADFLKVLAFSCGPLAVVGFALNHLYALNRPVRVTIISWTSLLLAIPAFTISIRFGGPTLGAAVGAVVWAMLSASVSLIWALASQPPVESVTLSSG